MPSVTQASDPNFHAPQGAPAAHSSGSTLPALLGTRVEVRLPLVLLAVLTPVLLVTLIMVPAGRLNWLLETGPGLIGIAVLAATFRRFPMSRWIYVCVFLHVLVLTYGAYYTYALTPLGNWARDTFELARNPYDRLGHFAQGFFPAFIIREVLLRLTPLRRGGWLNFLTGAVALAISAVYEFIEWWSALLLDPEGGDKFLGAQGDIWDAQWDMFMCLCGATVALLFFARAHYRSIERLVSQGTRAAPH
jgi:putative membrane protein